MTRSLCFALALIATAMTGCDSGFVAPPAFSNIDDRAFRLTLLDAAGDTVTTGEVSFDRDPQPGQRADGTYRLDDPGVGYGQSGDLVADYYVGSGDCAEQLWIRFDPRVSDAGLEFVTACEASALRGDWYEDNIQGRQVRGTFVLE